MALSKTKAPKTSRSSNVMASIIRIWWCQKCDYPRIEQFTSSIKRRVLQKHERGNCGRAIFQGRRVRVADNDCRRPATVEFEYSKLCINGEEIVLDPREYFDLFPGSEE